MIQCKICDSETSHYGFVDENKSCHGVTPNTNIPVEFVKCDSCGFIFTNHFDCWTKKDFLTHIYNDDYIMVDPDYYTGDRSRANAVTLQNKITNLNTKTVIDYGAGNKGLEEILKEKVFSMTSFDPMWDNAILPNTTFNLVTAFEVLEHTPTPIDTVRELSNLVQHDGAIFFSTLLNEVAKDVSCWYIAPRNGHICMYSAKSMDVLFGKFGMKVGHFNEGLHVAYFE